MKIEQTTLDNGLNTLFIDSPGSNISTIQIWFKAGSSLENKADYGIAHFLEHMFFKGTKKYPDAMIAKTVETFGGELNAFTSFDYTCYYINSPANHTLKSIDVLLDMVSNPKFAQSDLEPERDVVFEEYRRSQDSPAQYNFFRIQENSFPTPYKHPILGNEKTINGFTRKQLSSFRNAFYNNQNAMLIVAGDLSKKDQIEKLITSYKLPSGHASKFPKFKLRSNSDIAIHHKPINQATFTFTLQSLEYLDEKSPMEDLALNCLAFGDISPLYKDLIADTSLANGISGSTMFFSKGGCHFLKMACPIENVNKAIKQLEKSIRTSLKIGFTSNEIFRIKNQYLSAKVYEKETLESFAFNLGHSFAQSGNINCEDDFIGNMKHATGKQVTQSLIEIFSRDIHVNVQLPEGENILGLGEKLFKFRENINKEAKKCNKSSIQKNLKASEFDPEAKVIELKKNISLVYRRNLMTPTFSFHVYLKGGLAYETKDDNGIHNFISNNITYGHSDIKYIELKNRLEQMSSYINGFSGRNAYGLTLHGLSEHSTELFKHYFGMLIKPNFPDQYIEMERELLLRTIHLQEEDPIKHCFKTFNSWVFNNHPYEQEIIGSEENIKNFKRDDLIASHQKTLKESKIVISYCGDLDLDLVLEKIGPYIDQLNPRPAKKAIKNTVKPIIGKTKFIEFDREQTHIMIGCPAYKSGTKEDLYLKLFTTYLSGQSSELFLEVRDRLGLCYSVQALHHTALEAGYWGIYIGTGHEKVPKAIEAIMGIINKYQSKGLSKAEFNRVKKMINGQNLINIQTNDDYANFYSIPILHGLGLDFQHKTFDEIENLNVDDFNNFLKKFLKAKWNTVKVGRAE